MKKLFIIIVLLLLFSVSGLAGAVEPDAGAAALARYFSDDIQLFYGMRTDDAYLDELDSLLAGAIAKLPDSLLAGLPPTSLRDELTKALAQASDNTGLDFSQEALREWLGDYVAFGINNLNQSSPPTSLALSITDRAAAEAFWQSVLEEAPLMEDFERVDGDAFTLFQSKGDDDDAPLVAINDEVVLIIDQRQMRSNVLPDKPLSESETFQMTVSSLPAASYNIIGYVDGDAFDMSDTGLATTASLLTPGNLAFGLTILNDVTLTIDVAQSNPENMNPALPPLDPTFARFIPANAAAVVHSTNLTALYDLLVVQMKAMDSSTDAAEQMKAGLSMLGIDLQDDILAWTTGNYALYGGVDAEAYLNLMGLSMPATFETFPLNAGMLIEATDPEAAATLANKLVNTLKQFGSNQPDVTFSDVTVAGNAATVVSVPVPMSPQNVLTLEIVIGASEDVFFVGTAPDLMLTLAGEPGLDQSAVYQTASQYFVSQPSSIVYADDTGLLSVTVIPLALIGPSVGNIFDNIITDLDAQSSSSIYPEPQFVAYQSGPDPLEILQVWYDIVGSGSITSTYAVEGITLTRAVITLED